MAVATIAVSVKAWTAAFHKKMRGARKSLERFGAKVRAIGQRVARFGMIMAGVALGAFTLFVKQSFAALDSLAKASDRLGMAADKLRGFERAAELTGSSVKTLRKGFLNLAKNVSEAASGTGEALEAFKELRLDAKQLLQLSPDEIFVRIAKALDGIPTRVRKIGIISDIFTVRGAELLNMLEMGEDRLRAMVADGTRLFGTFSRLDLSRIEQANDAIADMRRALRSLVDRVAIELAGPVEIIATRLTNAFVGFRDTLRTSVIPALKEMHIVVSGVDLAVRDLHVHLVKAGAGLTDTFSVIVAAFTGLPGIGNALDEVAEKLERRAKKMRTAESRMRAQFESLEYGDLLGGRIAESIRQALAKVAPKPQELRPTPSPRMNLGAMRRAVHFQQVSPSLMMPPGLARFQKTQEQKVEDTKTHALLNQLIEYTRKRYPALAG